MWSLDAAARSVRLPFEGIEPKSKALLESVSVSLKCGSKI